MNTKYEDKFTLVFNSSGSKHLSRSNSYTKEKKPKSPQINIVKSPNTRNNNKIMSISPGSKSSRNTLKSTNSDKSKTPSPNRATAKQNSFVIDDVITKVLILVHSVSHRYVSSRVFVFSICDLLK